MIRILFVLGFIFSIGLMCADVVSANDWTGQSGDFDPSSFLSIGNEGKLSLDPVNQDDSNLVNRTLRYLTMSVGTFAVFMMIVGGYFMVTSQGDDNRLQKGKNIFLYTIIGILVAFSSYALVQFILSVLFKN